MSADLTQTKDEDEDLLSAERGQNVNMQEKENVVKAHFFSSALALMNRLIWICARFSNMS